MKIHSKFALACGILAVVFAGGCNDKEDDPQPSTPPTSELIMVGSAATEFGGILVNVFAHDSLVAEYTPLLIEVRDETSNDLLTNVDITVRPIMDMGPDHGSHGAPVESPDDMTPVDGKFPFNVVFTMPGETGWLLEIEVFDPIGDRGGVAEVPLSVGSVSPAKVLHLSPLEGSGWSTLTMALIEPANPKVGQNDFEVALFHEPSDFEFLPVEDLSLKIDPQMPSMGHGSPNNVHPSHTGNGHYRGGVNFTMTGTWVVNVRTSDGNIPVDTTAQFQIVF